jgi:hypothetical protein
MAPGDGPWLRDPARRRRPCARVSVCPVVLVSVVALPVVVGRTFPHQFVKSFDRLGE